MANGVPWKIRVMYFVFVVLHWYLTQNEFRFKTGRDCNLSTVENAITITAYEYLNAFRFEKLARE